MLNKVAGQSRAQRGRRITRTVYDDSLNIRQAAEKFSGRGRAPYSPPVAFSLHISFTQCYTGRTKPDVSPFTRYQNNALPPKHRFVRPKRPNATIMYAKLEKTGHIVVIKTSYILCLAVYVLCVPSSLPFNHRERS